MYAQYSTSSTASPSTLLSELESLSQLNNNSETSYFYNYNNSNCSSGYSSYVGSPSPTSVMQRSLSSHSFNNNINGTHHPFSAIFADLLDSDHSPVRRACSTGDLQRINGMQHNHHTDSPLSSESSVIIEGMSRACRYSPEEKKVRIERYRSKRNQRNFNKKIKYACRKTLADSRPRIRGRFARNDEIDKNTRIQWNQIGAREEEDEDDENWITMLDSFVAANYTQEYQGSSSFGLFY